MGKTPEQYETNDDWFDYDETHSRSILGESGVKIPEKVAFVGAATAVGLLAAAITAHRLQKKHSEEQ